MSLNMSSDEKIMEEMGETSHDTPQAITITIMDPSALETTTLGSTLVTSVQTQDTSHGTSTLLMIPREGQPSISVEQGEKDILQTVTETHMGTHELPVISNISNPEEETSEQSTIHVTTKMEGNDEGESEVLDEGEEGEDTDDLVGQHCLVCNVDLPPEHTEEPVPIFKTQTTTTQRKMAVLLGSLIGMKLTSRKAHSDIMCQRCFGLLDRVDALEVEIRDTKEEIVTKYQETVAVYGGRARRRKPATAKKTDYVFPKVEPDDEDEQVLGLEMDENFEPRVEDLMEEEHDNREDCNAQDEEWEPEFKRPRIKREAVDTDQTGPPKRKRGRPRKDASKPKGGLAASSISKGNSSPEDEGKDGGVAGHLDDFTLKIGGIGRTSEDSLHKTGVGNYESSGLGMRQESHEDSLENNFGEGTGNPCAVEKCLRKDIGIKLTLDSGDHSEFSKTFEKLCNMKTFECSVCHKKFTNRSNMNKHKKLHSDARPYICDKCGNSFRQIHSLKDHLKKHEADCNYYTCKYCLMKFKGCQKWITHENRHKGLYAFICEFCGMGYDNKQPLEDHMSKHTGQFRYYCSECDKGFNKIETLNDHVNVHTGDRPYSCEECGKKFANTGTFWQHKMVHKTERKYVCEICKKTFKLNSNLKAHIKTHGVDRKHVCDICGQAFLKKNHLCRHVLLHTGERPYVCERCGLAFPRGDRLKEHQQKYHRHVDM